MHVRLRRHPENDPTVEIRPRLGQRPHALALARQPVDRPLAQRAVQPDVRALIKPAIQLILKVKLVAERPPRLKAGLHELLQPLNNALRLTIPGIEDPPADRQLPTERRELLGRAPPTSMQTALPVDHRSAPVPSLP